MIENGQEYELSKQGVLTATGLLKLLPCARECPFGKACAEQYLSEESCTTAVDDFVSGTVYGSSGEKSIRGGEIHFTITVHYI